MMLAPTCCRMMVAWRKVQNWMWHAAGFTTHIMPSSMMQLSICRYPHLTCPHTQRQVTLTELTAHTHTHTHTHAHTHTRTQVPTHHLSTHTTATDTDRANCTHTHTHRYPHLTCQHTQRQMKLTELTTHTHTYSPPPTHTQTASQPAPAPPPSNQQAVHYLENKVGKPGRSQNQVGQAAAESHTLQAHHQDHTPKLPNAHELKRNFERHLQLLVVDAGVH